jgi:hypothetical protein
LNKGPEFSIGGTEGKGIFTADSDIPAPGTYDTDVQDRGPKFSFGHSVNPKVKVEVPGPGQYDTSALDKKQGQSVVMAGKIETSYDTISPGP